MKVLFINSHYKPQAQAGPAFFVEYLAEQLAKEWDTPVILCRNLEDRVVQEQVGGAMVYRFPSSLPLEQTGMAVRRVLMAEWPDVVHTNMMKTIDIGAVGPLVKSMGARLVHTVHEYRFICREGTLFDNGRICEERCPRCSELRPQAREFILHLDAVVGVSRCTLDRHLREGVLTDVPLKSVIHNPFAVDETKLTKTEGEKGILRLGFLGRVCLDKGIEVIFRECASLPPEVRYTLDIAGSWAPDLEEELARKYPGVPARSLGFVPQEHLFGNIDVLLMPSIWLDPNPRVSMEAFAFGVPVIATCLGGTPEVVDDGETGLIVDPLKPGDLKSKIMELAGDPERVAEMGRKALAKSAEFLPERILAQYREVYSPSASA